MYAYMYHALLKGENNMDVDGELSILGYIKAARNFLAFFQKYS